MARPIILYHGTNHITAEKILEEGLRGGDNTTGGTHGIWDAPALFMTPHLSVAKKYGNTILIIEYFPEFDGGYKINDGIGDECIVIEGEGILIEPMYITEYEEEE